jgi:hypothetical protein
VEGCPIKFLNPTAFYDRYNGGAIKEVHKKQFIFIQKNWALFGPVSFMVPICMPKIGIILGIVWAA